MEDATSSFISLQYPDEPDSESSVEKRIEIGESQDVKINLKVRSVQIGRPWIDLSVLEHRNWRIPGEGSNFWSTGVLDSSNKGTFPLLSTEMIVAKDISVTATEFTEEIVEHFKSFDPSVGSTVLVS